MKKRIVYVQSILIFTSLFISVGCGDPKVSGKVTFQDGSPLTIGKVYFEKDNFIVSGMIHKDGSYRIGKEKDGDGIPRGKYRVMITGTVLYEFPERKEEVVASGQKRPVVTASAMPSKITQLVDPKFASVSTSGLEVEVNGSMKYNIVVEPPKQ